MSPSLILASLALTAPPAPMAWSPDGRWLAFVDEEERGEASPPGWLFAADRQPAGIAAGPAARGRAASRLWATNPATGESALLDRSEGMHSVPAWGPGGMAVAFARLRPDAKPPTLELVIQDSLDRQRILLSRPSPGLPGDAAPPPIAPAVTWSPDGQFLTLPSWGAPGFEVVRADSGKVVASFPGMIAPAWSPDGTKLAFLEAKPGKEVVLCWSEPRARNAHRALISLGRAWQPPRWKGDGKSILAAKVQPTSNGSVTGTLLECSPETTQVIANTLHSLIDRQVSSTRPLERITWAIDGELDGLFYSATIRGQSSEIGYYLVRRKEPRDRFNPIDPTLPILEVALSPDEGSLAIRFGTAEDPSPPAVFRREGRRLVLLHPDRDAAGRWLAVHLRAATSIVRGEMSLPHLGERQIPRVSLIPLPDEDEANGPFRARLRRLAANGLEAIAEIARFAPAGEPDRLGEARLFFLALRESWDEALAAASDLEGRDPAPGDRWLTLRAQLELSKGDREAARGILGYLREEPRPRRLEETPGGPAFAPGPEPARWVDLLQDRLDNPAPAPGRIPIGAQILDQEQDFVPPIEAEMPQRINF